MTNHHTVVLERLHIATVKAIRHIIEESQTQDREGVINAAQGAGQSNSFQPSVNAQPNLLTEGVQSFIARAKARFTEEETQDESAP